MTAPSAHAHAPRTRSTAQHGPHLPRTAQHPPRTAQHPPRRYFVLKDDFLYYYKTRSDAIPTGVVRHNTRARGGARAPRTPRTHARAHLTHARTHLAHTHAHTSHTSHTRTHARARTHARTQVPLNGARIGEVKDESSEEQQFILELTSQVCARARVLARVRVRVRVCVSVCVSGSSSRRRCVRACVSACVSACVRACTGTTRACVPPARA